MNITIRQAKTEDALFLAQMILKSSRAGKKDGIFDLLFETNDEALLLEKLSLLVTNKVKNCCHYSHFLLAEVESKKVGTLCSYEPRKITNKELIQALKTIDCTSNIEKILNIFNSCSFELNNRTLKFDYMEELDEFLDVGILSELMKKSLLNARLKGYRIAQTIIEIGSLETELFYKKLGFSVTQQRECELYKEKFGRVGLMLLTTEF